MEQMDKRELISALADGQLSGEAFAQGVALAGSDAGAREAWHAYHLIGDVLRSADLASGVHSEAFIAKLQVRLRDEHAERPTALPVLAVTTREAANDGAFRWKMVAGVASVAAVSALAWTLVGGSPSRSGSPQLAAVPPGTVLTGTERGPMIRDPRLDELLAAHRQLGGAAPAMVAPAGYLRNATFDAPGR